MSGKLRARQKGIIAWMLHFRSLNAFLALILFVRSGLFLSFPSTPPYTQGTLTGPILEDASWTYADLRLLDPPDAPNPTQDVIAAYVRLSHPFTGFTGLFENRYKKTPREIQIRLDFLDLDIRNDADLYLALDHQPGGTKAWLGDVEAQIEWDTLIILPTLGPIRAFDDKNRAVQNLSIHALRDPILDTLVLGLDASKLPGAASGIRIQVGIANPGTQEIVDFLDPFRLSDLPPGTAPLLFTFWNTFPAYTPAQTLRRWDGAHTGPLGGRHGLYNLLRTARNYQIPLALLDLKSPISLSALDYVGGMPLVQRMAADNLLILPDDIPEIALQNGLPAEFISAASSSSRQMSKAFNLPTSPFVFAPLDGHLPASYPVAFTRMSVLNPSRLPAPGMGSLYRWREKTVIAIPSELLSQQATLEGLSLDVRKALIWTALLNAPNQALGDATFLVLGGDLPNSEWGVPEIARLGFRYLSAHPWIRPLYAHDLLAARPTQRLGDLQKIGTSPPSVLSSTMDIFLPRLIGQLSQLPASSITDAAWQSLFSLFGPMSPHPTELDDLRAIYVRQLAVLLKATSWAADPTITSSCDIDLDLDGRSECLLVSVDVFAAFDDSTGALTHLFVKTPSGIHQVVAPSSQFAAGLGESSSWSLDRGFSADPMVIPGAFAVETGSMLPSLSNDKLSMTGNGKLITYQIIPVGLSIEYRTNQPVSTRIPLALDPWLRYTPAWGERYLGVDSPLGWTWELDSGPSVHVQTDAKMTVSSFTETRKMMDLSENPNVEFPPSHFLPFPLVVLTLDASGDFYMEISLSD